MEKLDETLELLIDKKADDFEISKAFKEDVREYYAGLDESFTNSAGNSFLYSHTRTIENYIKRFYKYVIRDSFGNYSPPLSSIPVVFIAMGSFGREELCPYSDLDIMIVYKEVKGFNIKPLMERVLYLAWDAGLKLGHRVHELNDLKESADSDITIRTAMTESRFLFGSKFLWIETQGKLNLIRNSGQKAFIDAKLGEQKERREKNPKLMEPNLKESMGGTRDGNTLFWIARTILGIDRLKDLAGGVIADEDFKEIQSAIDFLNRVRAALHLIVGKKEDRVLFQYQRELALKLGFEDTKQRVAERRLMKRVFTALDDIHILSGYYLSKILREESFEEDRFIVKEGVICHGFSDRSIDINDFLEVYLAQETEREFDITFTGILRHSKIPKVLNKNLKKHIWNIFERNDSHKIIFEFYWAEVLDKIIPPFKPIIHLAQFDGYHQKSVDIHSIDTLKFLNTEEDEQLQTIFKGLEQRDRQLLRLVALLHDIGKGRSRDHSILGSRIIKVYAKGLGLKEKDIATGETLVRYHTLMSRIAQKEDIYSEKVLLSFVSKIKDRKTLDMLYLLTTADIKAVGDGVYTGFTKTLLRDLYKNACPFLSKTEQITEIEKRLRKEKILNSSKEFAHIPRPVMKQICKIESNLFFIKHTVSEIASIAMRSLETDRYSFYYKNRGYFELEIFSKEPIHLGWLLGEFYWLNIVSMDIFKLTQGVKYFKVRFKRAQEEEELENLEQIINLSFNMEKKLQYETPKIVEKEIEVDCKHSPTYARMTLNTADQKGLMAHVVAVFDRFGIDIATAKVSTSKKRTNDLFLIEKNGKFCDHKTKIVKELTKGQ